MRILGIDPGLAIVGYGVLDVDVRMHMQLVDYGTILTYPEDTLPVRLKQVAQGIRILTERFRPDCIAFEELFFVHNITTGIDVAQARGAALLAAAEYTDQLFEYTPLQVKQAVTGYGRAEKKQVQQMVKTLLHLSAVPRPDDAADGVAVAVCHANMQGSRGRKTAMIQ